ncbi:uncharacterized protein H6S33_005923 [Morchella sextelata]|uniref:uncharacterized protein n=1 Tax=Morchella sextelata TaxID=1174677 RepID=UPI001D047817|nr:uncharacterized protein H6S33_005923 [Morchella sextelata]KAH0614037.1 hypothetical protein H6S33_005923 [Morchella sextelata]
MACGKDASNENFPDRPDKGHYNPWIKLVAHLFVSAWHVPIKMGSDRVKLRKGKYMKIAIYEPQHFPYLTVKWLDLTLLDIVETLHITADEYRCKIEEAGHYIQPCLIFAEEEPVNRSTQVCSTLRPEKTRNHYKQCSSLEDVTKYQLHRFPIFFWASSPPLKKIFWTFFCFTPAGTRLLSNSAHEMRPQRNQLTASSHLPTRPSSQICDGHWLDMDTEADLTGWVFEALCFARFA